MNQIGFLVNFVEILEEGSEDATCSGKKNVLVVVSVDLKEKQIVGVLQI